jgi:hypothetical protein
LTAFDVFRAIHQERVMTGTLKALLATGAIGAAVMLLAPSAEAGQPWSCVCNGKTKRYIASTHMCEKDLHKQSKKPVASGFKLLVPACTRAQFIAWNTKLCQQQRCKPPKFSN